MYKYVFNVLPESSGKYLMQVMLKNNRLNGMPGKCTFGLFYLKGSYKTTSGR